MGSTEHLVTCPLCEAMCGLRIGVTDGHVSSVRPNKDDVWSAGHICPKGVSIGQLHHDPDRLRQPMVRRPDGNHVAVSWDDAYAEAERVLRPVLDSDGIRALTVYIGNPVAHNSDLASYIGALLGFAQAGGMQGYYSPGTVDQWPLNVVSCLLFGGMWNGPIPDLYRADHLMVLGANPAASQGSMLSAPDIMSLLKDVKARGAVVVVDPRRTATAERASEWVPIQPGTDALLLFAILRTLGENGWVRKPDHLRDRVLGLDEVVALADQFTPERVAAATGIEAPVIRRLAHDLAHARNPVVYSRIGGCAQEFGTLTTWLVFVLNTALGALDRTGGAVFAKPPVWVPMFGKPPDQDGAGYRFGRFHSRVRKAPEVLSSFPVGCLAEEIDTPGDGRIRALITVAGNPAVSVPGAGRLARALESLDAMISIDNWLNETTRHAHVIFPGLSPLEHAHIDDLYWIYAVASCIKHSEAVFDPQPDPHRPHEWELLLRLGGALFGTPVADVDVAALDDLYTAGTIATFAGLPNNPLTGLDAATVMAALEGNGPQRLADLSIRVGPWGDRFGERPGGLTLAEVKRHPNGLRLEELAGGRLDETVTTPSGKVELLHDHITDDIPRLVARMDRTRPELVMTSRRHLRSNNSWLHNVPTLMKGRDRCTLLIHPVDAARIGVSTGAAAEVSTTEGAITVPVEVSDEITPGVVSLPHGWGHGLSGTQLDIANAHPGVNNNLLNPTDVIDIPSNTHALNGIPCQIRPV
ncbi:molybdopterin-dependent oxidoreductase [Mycolicibacterium sphagni]|uniref:Molybdopterin dinucleotide-binding protein n=1 Tax=Mycolicibacterium sphagni TaxID=1786 RepID=A0A255DVN0_9MYCO|nr:molybdopterin-dependent oxidoreductase [Mycolicibacterium sphagni]MCV7176131.1 molybdopterin-dependent oxidoreductase [Mycolicibacterium sphagni]OYN82751.1 molybdopterin dinucleotide-binding protein [Mycolicibacterium sphagni]